MSEPSKTFHTPAEIAAALRITSGMVYKLVSTGQLRAVRIGSALRIPTSELDRYLSENSTTPAA